MAEPELPEEVVHFIARRIDSVPHLETLLLLWENPTATWSDAEISARVYVGRDRAKIILEELVLHGLIVLGSSSPRRYQYGDAWDDARIMQKVASTYRRHLVQVARMIHAKASSPGVLEFARAFEFKGKE